MNISILNHRGIFCYAELINEGHAILQKTKGTLNGRESGLFNAGGIMKTQAHRQRD
jgi:hypothetical protein